MLLGSICILTGKKKVIGARFGSIYSFEEKNTCEHVVKVMGTASSLCSHFVTNGSVGPLDLCTTLNVVGAMKATLMLYILDR